MEFKKLSDVEVVEIISDNANVLIEENGVIKRVPKTEVGGGSGVNSDEWDVIIDGGTFQGMTIDNVTWDDASIPAGSYNKIMDMVNAGEYPKILFKYTYIYGSVAYPGYVSISGIMPASSSINVSGFYSWAGTPMSFSTYINLDDTLYNIGFKELSTV